MIEDVIAAAGVSRGTFYNYFRTNAELLVAAIQALGNEVVDLVESRVKAFPSPAARLFTGLRLYMDMARRYPLFARFIARVGPQSIGPDALVYMYIPIPHCGRDRGGRVRRRQRWGRAGHGGRRRPHCRCAYFRRPCGRRLFERHAARACALSGARPGSRRNASVRAGRAAGPQRGLASRPKRCTLKEKEASEAQVISPGKAGGFRRWAAQSGRRRRLRGLQCFN